MSHSLRRGVQQGATLIAWMYACGTAVLLLWVVTTSLLTGWNLTVISGPSMAPSVRPGDVVLLDPDLSNLAQDAVITFDRSDGVIVTHRVFSVDGDEIVTRGDANANVDVETVSRDQIRGIARLMVPYIAQPLAWLEQGDHLAIALWATFTLIIAALALWASRDRPESPPHDRRDARIGSSAIRLARPLVMGLIIGQHIIEPNRFESRIGGVSSTAIVVLSALALLGLNALSRRMEDAEGDHASWPLVELSLDTALVLFLTTLTGVGGVGWVLFAVAILEASIRFGLGGALAHWMTLAALSIVGFFLIEGSTASSQELLTGLDELLDQLSVLLVIVVPGAFLAEQLLLDVVANRRATAAANQRRELMHAVASMGQDVTRLGTDVFQALAEATVGLGYDAADVWTREPDSEWTLAARHDATGNMIHAPDPRDATGCLTSDWDDAPAVVADGRDDAIERSYLERCGLSSILRLKLFQAADLEVSLRALTASGRQPIEGQHDALELLTRQVAVALTNERAHREVRRLQDQMAQKAKTDELTGMPNRLHFMEALVSALHSATSGTPVAVLFLDLDGFKPVNDQYGHEAGDLVLQIIARRLTTLMGPDDLAARLGGDEFTILLQRAQSSEAIMSLAHRVLSVVSDPIAVAGVTVQVSTSIGIAVSLQTTDASELLGLADHAMYEAKTSGRGVVVNTQSVSVRSDHRSTRRHDAAPAPTEEANDGA